MNGYLTTGSTRIIAVVLFLAMTLAVLLSTSVRPTNTGAVCNVRGTHHVVSHGFNCR